MEIRDIAAAELADLCRSGDLVVHGENLIALPSLPLASFQLIYIDPPFNTGFVQKRTRLHTVQDPNGDRTGFAGRRYRTEAGATAAYGDHFDDYLSFLRDRIELARDLLTESGTIYVHVDPRESHYVKIMLDETFGRDAFLNEIIWAYDFGGRPKDRWPAKHDVILVYVRTPGKHFFDREAIERIPYMAPGLVTPEKAARGKLPTDVWWHTIVPTNGHEKTGYPTQKPVGILRRIIDASSRHGDRVLDFFAGSGTTGAVAAERNRRFVLIDQNPAAIATMQRRLPGTTRFVSLRAPVDSTVS